MRFGFRELIFLMVLLAVPVASFIYIFKPRNEDIQAAKREIEVKQSKLDKLREVRDEIENIAAAIEKGQQAIDLIEAKLPSKNDVEGVLEQVWTLTQRNGLVVKKIEADKPIPAALYMELPLKMDIEGDFDGFYQFLLELESLDRITRIHEMDIERQTAGRVPGADNLPPGAMKSSFTLSIYFENSQSMASSS